MKNQEIAALFYEIADILEIKNIQWKPRAYRKAAQTIESLAEPIENIYKKGGIKSLKEIPGVGQGIAEKIEEYLKTGHIKEMEILKKSLPTGLDELMQISSLGPKKIMHLYKKLKIKNLKDLEQAIKKHRLRNLFGFGAKTEENIARGIGLFKASKERILLGIALPTASSIIDRLKKLREVHKISIAGSLRRMKETIGDIDILVTSPKSEIVMKAFTAMPEVKRTLAKGQTKSMVILKNGIQADVRVVDDESFGAALQYFTGSKDHNIKLREIAIKKGYKLNEYGLFKRTGRRIAGKTEKEIYKKLGLSYMEPELRENLGEIELARQNKLPNLITLKDIKGDLHVHTNWSDGNESIEAMIKSAMERDYEYIAITDHSKRSAIAKGLNEKKMVEQIKEIKKLRKKYSIKILTGSEVDILADGTLDFPDELLKKLDVVVAAVHSGWKMPKEKMTKRIIKALENPYVDILDHPTGRLIDKRPAYEVDMEEIFKIAKQNNKILEINAQIDRLDLKDTYIKAAIEYGLKLAISTDAHSIENLDFMQYGVAQARRGFAAKKDIINTLPFNKLSKYFSKIR
ncbi:MAG: DNA polymerase/3'-5' exonuclease PolX [Nanoarchaeota archaeon]